MHTEQVMRTNAKLKSNRDKYHALRTSSPAVTTMSSVVAFH